MAGSIWLAARGSQKLALKGDVGLTAERRKEEEGLGLLAGEFMIYEGWMRG